MDNPEIVIIGGDQYPVVRTGKMVAGDKGGMVEQKRVDVPMLHDAWPYDRSRPIPALITVYFVGPIDGPIKIGMASRIEFRLRDLRLANAFPLELWATVEGSPSLEREYHKRFAAHRLHGEWFARHSDILAEIDRLNLKDAA